MNSNVGHLTETIERPAVAASVSEDPDVRLVQSAMAGNSAAYEQLVVAYYPRILNFLSAKLYDKSDAEDVAQQTFIKAWRNIHRFDCNYRFSPWLYTIAARLAISHHRKHKRERLFSPENAQLASDQPTPLIEQDGKQRIWSIAQANLKPIHYQALWLYYHEELSVRETASALNKSVVHAKVMLFRARAALGKCLSANGISLNEGL